MGIQKFSELISAVNNEVKGAAGIGDIQKAINNAIDLIVTDQNWPFLLKQSNINTNPTYTTGTISGTDGTTAITLSGGTWDTTWRHKWVYIGSNFANYEILSFPTSTSATLATPLNIGQNLAGAAYTLYQDIYPLPTDMSVGREMLILNNQYRVKMLKPSRYTAENTSIYTRFWFNSYQVMYVDAGTDETTGENLIKFFPIPSSPMTYPIIYYRQIPYLVNDADTTVLPREFDQALIYLATAEIKMRNGSAGWNEAKTEGIRRIKGMRKVIYTSSAYDLYTKTSSWPFYGQSSITDGLAIIGPIPPGTGSM